MEKETRRYNHEGRNKILTYFAINEIDFRKRGKIISPNATMINYSVGEPYNFNMQTNHEHGERSVELTGDKLKLNMLESVLEIKSINDSVEFNPKSYAIARLRRS